MRVHQGIPARYGVSPSDFRRRPCRPRAAGGGRDPRGLRVEHLAALRVAFIRFRGPYAEVPPVFDRLREWASRIQPQEPLFLGLAHDDPGVTPPGQVRFEGGVVVTAEIGEGLDRNPAGARGRIRKPSRAFALWATPGGLVE